MSLSVSKFPVPSFYSVNPFLSLTVYAFLLNSGHLVAQDPGPGPRISVGGEVPLHVDRPGVHPELEQARPAVVGGLVAG